MKSHILNTSIAVAALAFGSIHTSLANGETPSVPYSFQGTVSLGTPSTATISVGTNSLTDNVNPLTFSGTINQGQLAKPTAAGPAQSVSKPVVSRIANKQVLYQVLNTTNSSDIKGYSLLYVRPNVLVDGQPAAPQIWAYKKSSPSALIKVNPSIIDLGIAWTDDGGQLGIEAGVFSGTASLTVNPATLEVATNNPSKNRLSIFTPYAVAFTPAANAPRFDLVQGIGTLTENNKGITGRANVSGYTIGPAVSIPK
jgi:hypothetical protein